MGINVRVWIGGAITVAALVGLIVWLFHAGEQPAGEERLNDRMSRTPVLFHWALRDRVTREGGQYAARLERAAADSAEADRLAREILAELEERAPERSDAPLLHHFGVEELDPALDRLHVVLAMVWSERHPEQRDRMPTYALLDEARALEPTALEPSLRGLAHSANIFAHSAGGYCEMVEPMVAEAERDLPATVMTDWVEDEAERASAGETLVQLQGFLVDGALACCSIRSERFEETRKRLRQSIADAERLGVCERRLPLLRSWAALLEEDRATAREELERLGPDALHDDDMEAHRVIRSAIATEGADATHRALMGSTRVKWLSQVVVAGAHQAIGESALAGRLRDGEAARAAQRFVAGEIAVIRAARRIDPFFEQERWSAESRPTHATPAAIGWVLSERGAGWR